MEINRRGFFLQSFALAGAAVVPTEEVPKYLGTKQMHPEDFPPNFPPNPGKQCQCQFCKEYNFMQDVLARGDVTELRNLVAYFADQYWQADEALEMELARNKVLRHGAEPWNGHE